MTFRSEDTLMGLIALALVPWIGWTVLRGVRDERLPIGRAYVSRSERPGAYWVLMVLWVAMALLAAVMCLDLLFRIDVRSWL